jgi:hypothetical protein
VQPVDSSSPPRFAGLYVRADDPQNHRRLLVLPPLRESALQRMAPESLPWTVTKAPAWKPKQQVAAVDIPLGPSVAPWLLLGTLALLLAEQFLTAHPLGGRG